MRNLVPATMGHSSILSQDIRSKIRIDPRQRKRIRVCPVGRNTSPEETSTPIPMTDPRATYRACNCISGGPQLPPQPPPQRRKPLPPRGRDSRGYIASRALGGGDAAPVEKATFLVLGCNVIYPPAAAPPPAYSRIATRSLAVAQARSSAHVYLNSRAPRTDGRGRGQSRAKFAAQRNRLENAARDRAAAVRHAAFYPAESPGRPAHVQHNLSPRCVKYSNAPRYHRNLDAPRGDVSG